MTLLERAVALEQNGTNDHVKAIGRQIKVWVEGVTATSMSKREMRNHLATDIGGYQDGQILKSVLNIDDTVKSQLESLINDAKTFAAE
jgi:hypothetical protein